MKEILETLGDIALAKNVTVLMAVESGSRAWGFASKDSDYDVRFVYQQPLKNYLGVHAKRDVLEPHDIVSQRCMGPAQLDVAGWDLRKFLQLASKSNPTAFEWLQSTIVYSNNNYFLECMRANLLPYFSPKAAMHHYISRAKHNYREHMRDGASPTVRLKKYLYITRPILCCLWLDCHPGEGPPPMSYEALLVHWEPFAGLLPSMPPVKQLRELAERKRAGDELETGSAMPEINAFIDYQLARLRAVADEAPGAEETDTPKLDELFYGYATGTHSIGSSPISTHV